MLQQQVDRHQVYAAFTVGRQNTLAIAPGLFMNAEDLGNGGAGDVGIQHGGLVALSLHGHRQKRSDQALAYATLTADDANDFVDTAARIGFFHHIPGRIAFPAVLTASFAVVCAPFAHGMCASLLIR